MPTFNIVLRNRTKKNGAAQLRIVIQEKGKRLFIPLSIWLQQSQWDEKLQRVKKTHPRWEDLNAVLVLKMSDLQAKAATQSINGKLDVDMLAGKKIRKTSFKHFSITCLGDWENSKSINSIRAYRSMLKGAMGFDSTVNVEDIGPDWLARYESYCRKQCGDGGTLKRIAFISVILKEAIRRDIIQRDPFLIYKKPAKKNPPKIWLTIKELDAIEKHAKETKSEVIRNTSYWFLLACYTGLRYSDIEKFNHKKAVQDGRLVLYTQKTGEVVSIKITKKIKELLSITAKLPPVYTNQKVNGYLKAVAHLSKIDKLLTFHSARHTFGVQCANLGIGQEVAAKLLGHSDLKTTAIYYKITNLRVDDEMKKWER